MIVADGVELGKHNGQWSFTIEPEYDQYERDAVYARRVDARKFVLWIREFAPELLREE